MDNRKRDERNELSDWERDRRLAAELRRAWSAFFQHYGRLTPVQREAIPFVLAREDVLISAATDSGKTEAACAPLVERLIDRSLWTLLYLSPTRALINDLYHRLEGPLRALDLTIERRTGEYRPPSLSTLCAVPEVLLTTPESLDSMLCRDRLLPPYGHRLAHVAAVVLDEIQLLYGTARGEQVRWLIERLRRLRIHAVRKGWTATDDMQIVALSATVADSQAVVDAFLPGGRVVAVPGSRAIEVVDDSDREAKPTVERLVLHLSRVERREKVLVFCPTRKRTDALALELNERLASFGYSVWAHHGSLSKGLREEAEKAMKERSKIVLVATSTLEIGIDIGDIDLVVLDGPPPNVSSLLQRVGRGNRRTERTRVLTGADNAKDVIVCRAMVAAAREGWFGDEPDAVSRQQVLSYIFQAPNRKRSRAVVQSLLDRLAEPIVRERLLDTMVANGDIVIEGETCRLSERWLNRADRGEIHSNIESEYGMNIVDVQSGKTIAREVRYRRGRHINIAGDRLDVVAMEPYRLTVMREQISSREEDWWEADWSYAPRKTFLGDGYAHVLRWYLNLPEDEWPVVQFDEHTLVFHFGGRRLMILLQLALPLIAEDRLAFSVDPLRFVFLGRQQEKPSALERLSSAEVERLLPRGLEQLERFLGRPNANSYLPREARIDEVQRWLLVSELIGRIRQSVWKEAEGELKETLLRYFGSPVPMV